MSDPNRQYLRGHELGCEGCFDCRYCGDAACLHWPRPRRSGSGMTRFGCRSVLSEDGDECPCESLDPEEPEFVGAV